MPKIATNVLAAIDGAILAGNTLTLVGQLKPKVYREVAKVIELSGGKWNKKAKCHLFPGDAAEAIEPAILTGEIQNVKQDFGQFDTPRDVGEIVIAMAQIEAGMDVLEPSVGIGNLACLIEAVGGRITAFEIDINRAGAAMNRCKFSGGLHVRDFLAATPLPCFHRVVMNSPFAGQADIKHVMHATKFLLPGGRLVAIMSNGVSFRTNRLTLEFKAFLADHGGKITALPADSFKSGGTSVNTVVVSLDMPS
jgi:hypothetical protein